jgi:processive 1,2-diacylglycerol beta-glucosyltransferase
VKVLAYTNQVPELMSVSDLIVTKPGWLTTTESLASWLPMLLINPIPWQEVDNTNFLEEQNIWIYIDEGNCKQVIDKLFSNNDLLKKMWQKAKSISKANATEEICKAIWLSM